jgi:type IV pilus assembly protein PilW
MRFLQHPHFTRQRGVTLVELMVALTLGLILLAAASQVFVANKSTYRLTQALGRAQENGRYAMQRMAYDLRMTGYLACGAKKQMTVNVVADDTPPAFTVATSLIGYDGSTGWWTTPSVPPVDPAGHDLTICDAATDDTASCRVSDVVSIMRASENSALLQSDMADTSADLAIKTTDFADIVPAILPADAGSEQEDLVLVSNCVTADLFRVTATGTSGANTELTPNTALGTAYEQGAFVQPLVGASYFIADPGVDADGDGTVDPFATLYRIGFTDEGTVPTAVPIAEGIEKMTLTYGEETTGDDDADVYVNSAGVTDWSRVVSIRVALLIKSKEDFVTDVPATVTWVDGTTINDGVDFPADRRLRLVFTQTISLRNRLP